MLTTSSPVIVGPNDGMSVTLQTVGVRFMIPSIATEGRFSLVEHPLPPRALAAPLHRHNLEDEYSFILEGRMGALLGDDVVEAGPGDLVYKPRGQWHTFWNAGDEPARILEIIAPAGFEVFFAEFAQIITDGVPDLEKAAELCARYELDLLPETPVELCARFGLWFPGVE